MSRSSLRQNDMTAKAEFSWIKKKKKTCRKQKKKDVRKTWRKILRTVPDDYLTCEAESLLLEFPESYLNFDRITIIRGGLLNHLTVLNRQRKVSFDFSLVCQSFSQSIYFTATYGPSAFFLNIVADFLFWVFFLFFFFKLSQLITSFI